MRALGLGFLTFWTYSTPASFPRRNLVSLLMAEHYCYVMLIAQSCPTLCDPMDCSPPVSSVHEIFQARILEWVAISFSRGSSQPRDRTQVSCNADRVFTDWATREAYQIPELSQTSGPDFSWFFFSEADHSSLEFPLGYRSFVHISKFRSRAFGPMEPLKCCFCGISAPFVSSAWVPLGYDRVLRTQDIR